MITFMRKLLGLCDHKWTFVRNINLNEFDGQVDDDGDDEVVSSREFSKRICLKCKKVCFRKL